MDSQQVLGVLNDTFRIWGDKPKVSVTLFYFLLGYLLVSIIPQMNTRDELHDVIPISVSLLCWNGEHPISQD
jgi:hypothetical protein